MKKKYSFALLFSLSLTIQAQLDYKDVAAIFYAKCASCHNPNGIANSDFTNYAGTAAYASTISNYVQNGIMPPWPPDTTYTRFVHERTINTTQKAAILQWVSDGALAGNLSLAPSPPTFSATQLKGTPDAILQMPTYTSTATGSDKYVCFSLPSGLTQDRYLRAYEIIPGNPAIVHHVVVNVDSTGNYNSNLTGACYNMPSNTFSIGDYAPGAAPQIFPGVAPVKFGIRIKAGSKIILQMHYPAGTNGQQDSTQIRLYFYPPGETGIRPLYNIVALQNWTFSIPPNTTQLVTAQYPTVGANPSTIPFNASIYSVFPHSHQICKTIENYAKDASNNKINLIKINDWRFHWQGFYTFRKMLKIPAGSKVYGEHLFDNTTSNPNNPANPTPVTVNAGLFTNDEMLFDGMMWAMYQPGDENVDIEAILANDPLLTGIKKENNVESVQLINPFPNPFQDKTNIAFSLNKPEFVTLSISNILGEKIKTISSQSENVGYTQKVWDGTNQLGNSAAAGMYIYNLQIGNKTYSGKLIVSPKN